MSVTSSTETVFPSSEAYASYPIKTTVSDDAKKIDCQSLLITATSNKVMKKVLKEIQRHKEYLYAESNPPFENNLKTPGNPNSKSIAFLPRLIVAGEGFSQEFLDRIATIVEFKEHPAFAITSSGDDKKT